MAKFKRILLKLSGESLMGKQSFGIDPERLSDYAKQIKECERKLEKLVLNYAGDVNILLCGDSTGINIVKLDEDIVNDELNNLQPSSTIFYTLNGENYYKCQDKIFFTKKIHVETKTFEHGYSGLKNRGGTFQYYGNILDLSLIHI